MEMILELKLCIIIRLIKFSMKLTNITQITLIMLILVIVFGQEANLVNAQANKVEQFTPGQNFKCSSLLSHLQKNQLSIIQAQNVESLSIYLINGHNIIQKVRNNDAKFFSDLVSNFKAFLYHPLKPFLYVSAIFLLMIIVTNIFMKVSVLQQKGKYFQKVNSILQLIGSFLLVICILIVLYSSIQSIIQVTNQPALFSELVCMVDKGPRLRYDDRGNQKLITLDQFIEMISLERVYFEENRKELSLFVNYRIYLSENLSLAQFIQNSINFKKAQKGYIQQIQSLIGTLQQMSTVQTLQQAANLKRYFHIHVSTHVQIAKILSVLNRILKDNFVYSIFYNIEIILFSSCLIISLFLAFCAYNVIKANQSSKNNYRFAKSFALYLIIIFFVLFAVLSLLIVSMFWLNNGVFKLVENNQLLNQIKNDGMAVPIFDKLIPNQTEYRKIKREKYVKQAQNYYDMLNPIAEKQNNHYYNLFKKSISFLSEPEKRNLLSKLESKYINNSEIIKQAKIAQQPFKRIIDSLNINSTLTKVEFSDYGTYLLKSISQLRKIIFTNFYSLRNHTAAILGGLIVFYILSFISKKVQGKAYIKLKQKDEENLVTQQNL